MKKRRVVETDQGIQGEFNVTAYDHMQRSMRNRGWIETRDVLKSGIAHGRALEVGPGPGYLGLEWLKHTEGTSLTGLEIGPDMIALARKNCSEYGFAGRAEYVQGNGSRLPFADESFDAVFTNGSLHEWADPKTTFNEMWRVLKSGGRLFVSDLRRDMTVFIRWFLWITVRPKAMSSGLVTSIDAAYTPAELIELIRGTRVKGCSVTGNPIGVVMTGNK